MKKLMTLMMMCLLATGCGMQNSSTGAAVTMPNITMTCTAPDCMQNQAVYVTMYVSAYSCSLASLESSYAVRSYGSETTSCSATLGCAFTFDQWQNMQSSQTSTVPTNTYSLCAVISSTEILNNSDLSSATIIATGETSSQKITSTSTTLSVSTFYNGSNF